jgi:uncharacterized protein involved in exopolysaccharide biosynthesis
MQQAPDPYGDNLDLRSLAQGLARSARWVIVLTLLGGLVGLGSALMRPNTYVSVGKIEVRLGIRERRTPESSLNPQGDTPVRLPGIGDELELLYNPELYQRVARQIGPERLLASYDPKAGDGPHTARPMRWMHAVQSWWFARNSPELSPEQALLEAAALAASSIEVVALGGTSYLLISSTASTPKIAQLLTQAYVSTARQWHREVYSTRGDLPFVTDQLKRYEDESVVAEQALSEHHEKCGFYDLEAQKSSLVVALEEHRTRIQEYTIALFEIEEELVFVERELEGTPTTIEKLIPPSVKVNPEYQASLDQLRTLTSERAGLGLVYTEGSELFQRKAEQLGREVRRVEERLGETPNFIEYGTATREESVNPRHEELTIRSIELRRERETRTRTVALWRDSEEQQNVRLRAALKCAPTHRDLAQSTQRAKTRVNQLSAALERTQAIALLDRQEEMDSLRIALSGDLPLQKEGPQRGRFLLLGLAGGVAAGLFLAALRFLMDTRLHDPEALRREAGVNLIGVVPDRRGARMRTRRHARAGA